MGYRKIKINFLKKKLKKIKNFLSNRHLIIDKYNKKLPSSDP